MIRVAGSSDITEIRALMKAVAGFWDETWRPDVLERAMRSSGAIALVHQDGEAIDGFVCAHDLSFRAYLGELVVSPHARRRGIGSRLLSEIERRMVDRGCSLIAADVWRDAEGFYRSQGWTPPSVVLLRKRLSKAAAQPAVAAAGGVGRSAPSPAAAERQGRSAAASEQHQESHGSVVEIYAGGPAQVWLRGAV